MNRARTLPEEIPNGANHQLPAFMVVWSGQLASSLGNGMTAFALAVHVYQQTQTATSVSLVIMCLYVPAILLRPLGGLLADRIDRRLLIVCGDIGSASGVLLLLLSALSGSLGLGWICIGVGISSVFVALQNPAYKAAVTDLLPPHQYSRASGLVQLASSAQHLISPLLAGIMLHSVGLIPVLIIDLSTFGIAVAAAMTIRSPLVPARKSAPLGIRADLWQGWLAIRADQIAARLVLLMSMVTLFVGVLQTVFAPMLLSLTDARSLGYIQSFSATGMLASSLLIGIIGIRRHHRSVLALALILLGFFLGSLGASRSVALISAAFFLFFFTLPFINTCADVLIRSRIPNELQGRAWGIISMLTQLGYIAAYSTAGVLADRVFTPLLAGSGSLAAGAGWIVGSGPGRGIAFMLVLSGAGLVLTSVLASVRLIIPRAITSSPEKRRV